MKPFAIAILIVTAASAVAPADILYPAAIVLEPGYASGPPQGFPWLMHPDYGDPLIMLGRVTDVGPPFDDLVPAGVTEITYVIEGASCSEWGNWDNIPCGGGLFGTFTGGTVTFYLDDTPDADFANPATFRDGEVLLLAVTSSISVLDDDNSGCPQLPDYPDVWAGFTFSGGTWFSRVSDNGQGLSGSSAGQLDDDVPAELRTLGYIFRVDGTVDVFGPVATEQTTWGRVKAMYR